jgi:ribosomal protein S18 acetylase RimI-like enzyme
VVGPRDQPPGEAAQAQAEHLRDPRVAAARRPLAEHPASGARLAARGTRSGTHAAYRWGVQIRAARRDEIEGALALWRTAGSEPAVNATAEGLEALFDRDPGALLVAEEDGLLVGTLVAAWDGWRGALYRLAVLPSQRRRGLALALVEAGERRLQALGARRIALVALHDREDAVGFWAAAGYEPDRRITRFVKTLG